MFNNKRNNKKNLLELAWMGGMACAQAGVLAILPESGPMARAASSIKRGFQSACAASDYKAPVKFVNSGHMPRPRHGIQNIGQGENAP